jgi:CO/xanthine dehydrogenase FAD-binding subunit
MRMDYHRPHSLDEALALLKEGVPLAGGTSLAPRRGGLTSVVDLQDTGLDSLEVAKDELLVGACVTLQSLATFGGTVPAALVEASHLEAGWNLRNMATVGGTLIAADGRSPLITTLLALGASVELMPGDEDVDLDDFLTQRDGQFLHRLITRVAIPLPSWLLYEQVARSPADRPIVCAGAAEIRGAARERQWRVALGGYGARPVIASAAEPGSDVEAAVAGAEKAASQAYSQAEDAWASAEYRSEVAGVLVARLLREGATS